MHVMKRVFDTFEEKNIVYAHFKSNKNLDVSFSGLGDFDVLVDRYRISEIEMILSDVGGKRCNPIQYGNYPGVDNWLLYDEETGMIHHLHLHYQLASGKAQVKEYIIPWADTLLQTRVKEDKYQIYISSPEMELLLLTVRLIIKARWKDFVKSYLGLYQLYPSLKNERDDLINKVDLAEMDALIDALFSEKLAKQIKKNIRLRVIKGADFLALNKTVRKYLLENRRMSGSKAAWLKSFYGFCKNRDKVLKRYFDKEPMIKKTPTNSGLIIAFVGVDGSGKSTMTKEITEWLGNKVEAKRFYMGTGDGKTTVFVTLMKSLQEASKATGAKAKTVSGDSNENKVKSTKKVKEITFLKDPVTFIKRILRMQMIVSVEKNNTKKIIRMNSYRSNGGVALLDRYPQIEIEGCNDGPKISSVCEEIQNASIVKKNIRKEMERLDIVKRIKPDMIFRLNISAETSMSRKPEQTDINTYIEKIDLLKKITFQNARIIDIDAEQNYEDELKEIKKIIWENL